MDKTVDYDSIGAMMEFTEILKKTLEKHLILWNLMLIDLLKKL